MLVAVPELTGVYPLTLDEPIAPRSIYLFQRKNQPLSIAPSTCGKCCWAIVPAR